MSSSARTATFVAAALVLLFVLGFVVLRPATTTTTSVVPGSASPTLTAITSPPSPTATAAPISAPTATAGATQSSAEQVADALAAALGASDFAALESLITPNGFNWAKSGSGGLAQKTPQEAVQFLRSESGGRLQVTVVSRPIRTSSVPWGPRAIASTWRAFGNVPQQSIELVLHEVGGRWYWAGGFITS